MRSRSRKSSPAREGATRKTAAVLRQRWAEALALSGGIARAASSRARQKTPSPTQRAPVVLLLVFQTSDLPLQYRTTLGARGVLFVEIRAEPTDFRPVSLEVLVREYPGHSVMESPEPRL